MKCRIDFSPELVIKKVIKGPNEQIIGLEVEPLFFAPEARTPALFLTCNTDKGKVLSRAVIGIAGRNGRFYKEDRNRPVPARIEVADSDDSPKTTKASKPGDTP